LETERKNASAKLRQQRERELQLAEDAATVISPLSDEVLRSSSWAPEEASRAAARRKHKSATEKKENAARELDRVRDAIRELTSLLATIDSERTTIEREMLVP
jgi:hypothetical protein